MQLTMVSVTLNVFPNLDCNFGLALLMFNKTLDAKKISVQNTFHLSVTLTAKYVSFGQDHGGSEAKLWCAKAEGVRLVSQVSLVFVEGKVQPFATEKVEVT
ncbi:unnamed protein product [Clavelina lepadiformis]|uniref:Uncharacterized protein n=1 Tax=Clavelina lepadiformis TaxID=159417 RepID=A0ABP0FL23_CLALP